MARPKYEIKEKDVLFAKEYLISQLNSEFYDVNPPGKHEFLRFVSSIDPRMKDLENDARLLNKWCETCLDSEQWEKLKVSIRKKRRQADREENNKKKETSITISPNAHDALKKIKVFSKKGSLSEAIIWAEKQLKGRAD